MRTNDEKLAALIRAALTVLNLGSDMAGNGGLSAAGVTAIDALDTALAGLDAHDLYMSSEPPARCVCDGEPAVGRGQDGLLLCAECSQWSMDRGEFVGSLQ